MYEADVVVHGTGLFNIPMIPQEFEGFRGEKWHSARWRHDVDLAGKRVGVVGVNARYFVCVIVMNGEDMWMRMLLRLLDQVANLG